MFDLVTEICTNFEECTSVSKVYQGKVKKIEGLVKGKIKALFCLLSLANHILHVSFYLCDDTTSRLHISYSLLHLLFHHIHVCKTVVTLHKTSFHLFTLKVGGFSNTI